MKRSKRPVMKNESFYEIQNVRNSSLWGSAVINPASIHEDVGSIPGIVQWVKDPALLWLWHRLAAAAPIGPLAWEPPYAAGGAQARGRIRAVVAGLCHSHSNAGSLTHRVRPEIEPTTSWFLVGFVSAVPRWELY